jgi:hypothetical protein
LLAESGPTYSGETDAGWSSSVARWAHNPEVAGSNPAPATKFAVRQMHIFWRTAVVSGLPDGLASRSILAKFW